MGVAVIFNSRPWAQAVGNAVIRPTLLATLLAFALLLAVKNYDLSLIFLAVQDRWLLLTSLIILLLSTASSNGLEAPLRVGNRTLWCVATVMLIICLVGHYIVLAGYDMSRDEQMATFDAAVLGSGRLVEPLPAFWHDHSTALNLTFMIPAEQRAAWISSYLPGNAVLRALAGSIVTSAMTGPLMTGLGAIALWGCGSRIWPEDREARTVALILYLGSAQIVITGMTAYAMPAHLTLNLIWLWLFLRRAWWADLIALLVGFAAVGLHQPLMHPLFAGPLLFLLVFRDPQWRRAAFFAVGYAAIGVFWLSWPNWTWALVQASADTTQPSGVDYFTRLATTVRHVSAAGLIDMIANILRFAAWQHLLLVPLLIIGIKIAHRDRLAGALAAGVILTVIVMTVILPYQGHGFGYRYLHGLIGNCILLAIYGWKSLAAEQGRWRAIFIRSSLAGFAIMLPLQMWMANAFYAPAATASQTIGALDADFAILGAEDVPFAADLVYNSPKLDNRPVRLLREEIDPALATAICRRGLSVTFVDGKALKPIADYYGVPISTTAASANLAMGQDFSQAGCTVNYLN